MNLPTILLVEDDGPIRDLARRFLSDRGYRVLVAANGPEALSLARGAGQIDLLVSDVKMPYMSGTDLALRLIEAHPETRVLLISGYMADMPPVAPGRTWFLPKPFTSAQFLEKVRQILDTPDAG